MYFYYLITQFQNMSINPDRISKKKICSHRENLTHFTKFLDQVHSKSKKEYGGFEFYNLQINQENGQTVVVYN